MKNIFRKRPEPVQIPVVIVHTMSPELEKFVTAFEMKLNHPSN